MQSGTLLTNVRATSCLYFLSKRSGKCCLSATALNNLPGRTVSYNGISQSNSLHLWQPKTSYCVWRRINTQLSVRSVRKNTLFWFAFPLFPFSTNATEITLPVRRRVWDYRAAPTTGLTGEHLYICLVIFVPFPRLVYLASGRTRKCCFHKSHFCTCQVLNTHGNTTKSLDLVNINIDDSFHFCDIYDSGCEAHEWPIFA